MGDTNEASKSPTAYVLVTTPGGGEVWPQGQTFPIRWRSDQSTANALSFNGSSQYVSIANSPSLDSASLTVEGWFNFASTSGTQTLFSKAAGNSSSSSFAVTYSGGYLSASIGGPSGNGSAISFQWTPTSGTWRHIAFTFDSASETETLYLDGVAVASGAANQAIGYDAHPVILGAQSQNSAVGNWFSGTIDEVRFWNSARIASNDPGQHEPDSHRDRERTRRVLHFRHHHEWHRGRSDRQREHCDFGQRFAGERAGIGSVARPSRRCRIDLIAADGTTLVETIATSVPDNGEFLWAIPESLAAGNYLIRVTRTDNSALSGTSDATFTVTPPIHVYYVATSSPSGDALWATAPGNDGNSGLDAADPKASISAVLAAYQLGPGDIIRVDAGTYDLSTNICS